MNTKKLASPILADEPTIGKDCQIKDTEFGYANEVGNRCKLLNVRFDDFSYIGDDSDVANTQIGKFCSIAAHTRINPGNHPLERVALHHFTYRAALYGFGQDEDDFFQWRKDNAVTIGHDVWLGHGAIVLANVSIGHGAAIGAGTIVTKDVEPYSIVVGNPGKTIRYRFDEKTIENLLALEWWNWDNSILAKRLADFRQLSAEAFVEKYLG